jgi:single-strand DNA-binding protein
MNKIIIDGALTKQPELRFTPTNKAVANFDIANNEGFGDKKETNFFKVVTWNKTAEKCANFLDKGSKVLICGKLINEKYEDKQGNKKTISKIIATEVQFLSKVEGNKSNEQSMPVDAFSGGFEDDITPIEDGDTMPF